MSHSSPRRPARPQRSSSRPTQPQRSESRRAAANWSHLEPLERRALLTAAVAAVDLDALLDRAYDESRILVRMKDGAPGLDAAKVLPGTALGRAVGLDRSLREVRLGRGVGVDAALAAYGKNPHVEYAEPNWIYTTQATSNDTHYANGNLWGMYGDTTSPANAYGSQAAEAWAQAGDSSSPLTGSKDVYIGIIDEGVDVNHPDLSGNVWTNPFDRADGVDNDGNGYVDDVHGWDFNGNNSSVYDGTSDDHGTHVAGTIGAEGGNGIGVTGVNWDVTLIPGKFLGATGGSTLDAIEALDYFTDLKTRHGLNIVATNNSWGGGGYSQALFDAITRSANADILFIAAAGNGGEDKIGDNNDALPSYPSNYDTTATAGYDAVIAVAAIDAQGGLGDFSNFGARSVDLGAPGVMVASTMPENAYGYNSGTSMATPHVAGAAALYAAAHPGSSALTIRNALLDSARVAQTGSLSGKTTTGGRLDVSVALLQSQVPAAPANLSASATSSSQIALTWSDLSGNEEGFHVERFNSLTKMYDVVATVGRNATSWSDAGLSANTSYTYQVRAYRGTDASAASNSATAVTAAATAAPNAPTELTATGSAADTVALAWRDNSGDESGFTLERSTDANFAGAVTRLAVAANATTYTDTGLTATTTYYYRVQAFRADASATATSGYSNAVTAVTAARVGTGNGLRGDYYDNMLTESSSDPNGYSLSGWKFARTDPTVDFAWGTGAPTGGTTKTRLAADTFTVKWTGMIEPRYTDDYTFRFQPDDGVGMWVTVEGVRKQLWTPTWDRYDGTSANGTSNEYANTSAHESAPLALKAGVKYPIEIVYYEYTGGAAAKLMWRSAKYQQPEAVPATQLYHGPTNLVATGVAAGRIDLAWADNAADEGGFKIERSTNGSTWSQIATVAANVTTFSNTGLTAGAPYYYRVRAYNGTPAFNSAYSNSAVAKAAAPTTASTATAVSSGTPAADLFSARRIEDSLLDALEAELI